MLTNEKKNSTGLLCTRQLHAAPPPVGDNIVGFDNIFNQCPFPWGKLILSNALLAPTPKGRIFDLVVKIRHLNDTLDDSTDVNVPTPWIKYLSQPLPRMLYTPNWGRRWGVMLTATLYYNAV